MKTLSRILFALVLVGVAALTLTVEQSRSSVKQTHSEHRAALTRIQPRVEAIRQAQRKRLDYYQHLLFLQFPSRLVVRLGLFLCQLDACRIPEMEWQSFRSQAEAAGFRFTLKGTVRGVDALAVGERVRFFLHDAEKLEGAGELVLAEVAPLVGEKGHFSFVLTGMVGVD